MAANCVSELVGINDPLGLLLEDAIKLSVENLEYLLTDGMHKLSLFLHK